MVEDEPQAVTTGNNDECATCTTNPDGHDSLKYHLLGPSLTKAGQDSVDQQKVWMLKRAIAVDFPC